MAKSSIGSTALHLSVESSDYEKGLDHAAKLFKVFAAKTKRDAAQLQTDVRKGLSFGDIFKVAGGVAGGLGIAGGVSSLASGLTGLVTDSIKLAASVEDTATDFRVMIGDAKEAADLFARIRDFAGKTPLETSDLAAAAKTLLSIGVSSRQIVPTLQALGDLAGGQGEKLKAVAVIYGQIRTEGKLSGENLKQLGENGIVLIDELARVLGVSKAEVAGLAGEGRIGFSDLQRAIQLATGEGGRFFGLMDERSKTFNGLLSTLKDNWEQLLAGFGEVLIDEFGLKGVLEGLSGLTEKGKDNLDEIRPIVRDIADVMKKIAADALTAGLGLAQSMAQVADSVAAIHADYASIKNISIGIARFPIDPIGGILDAKGQADPRRVARGPAGGPIESSVARIRAEIEKLIGTGMKAMEPPRSIWNPFGKEFGGAAGKAFAIEADQLNRDMIKRVRNLREEFDPLAKIRRELADLNAIRDRGGFNKAGLAGMIGRAAGGGRNDDLFAFGVARIFEGIIGRAGDMGRGSSIATAGSSDAVKSIIAQQNSGLVKQEDRLQAALKIAEKQRAEQLKWAKRLVELIEQKQIPGLM